jgi:flagellar basal-body rod protein FlgC
MDLKSSIQVSASGMRAQGERMRIVAENLANADSVAKEPGGDPYRRKVLTFKNELDRNLGIKVVKPGKVEKDKSDFEMVYDPGHPAADANGYIKRPNVRSIIEMADMREAQRSYEANVSAIDIAKNMVSRLLDLLR